MQNVKGKFDCGIIIIIMGISFLDLLIVQEHVKGYAK